MRRELTKYKIAFTKIKFKIPEVGNQEEIGRKTPNILEKALAEN